MISLPVLIMISLAVFTLCEITVFAVMDSSCKVHVHEGGIRNIHILGFGIS